MEGDQVKPVEASERGKASFFQTVRAVASSFFGVRGSKAHENDLAKLNPVHVIAVGIGMAALFVFTLIWLVKFILAK
jgi:Protein of unknown function (DUF2970)